MFAYLIFLSLGQGHAAGWVEGLIAPAPLAAPHSEVDLTESLCRWQIRLSRVPEACYRLKLDESKLKRLNVFCLGVIEAQEGIDLSAVHADCRRHVEKLYRIKIYRTGDKRSDWSEF